MKPKLPFMLMCGDLYVKIDMLANLEMDRVKLVDWDGSRYATKEAAEKIVKVFGLDPIDIVVIEVLEEIRKVHRYG